MGSALGDRPASTRRTPASDRKACRLRRAARLTPHSCLQRHTPAQGAPGAVLQHDVVEARHPPQPQRADDVGVLRGGTVPLLPRSREGAALGSPKGKAGRLLAVFQSTLGRETPQVSTDPVIAYPALSFSQIWVGAGFGVQP